MRDCLIIGSGRSGTSMLGGIMHEAGYFMGEKLYSGTPSNPKGYFESPEINDINESILLNYNNDIFIKFLHRFFDFSFSKSTNNSRSIKSKIRNTYQLLNRIIRRTVLDKDKRQQWLVSLSPDIEINYYDKIIKDRIRKMIKERPFCYKDPRFSYTIDIWRSFLPEDTKFLCVFRDPGITVNSIIKDRASSDYLKFVFIDEKYAYKMYANIYTRILNYNNDLDKKTLYVHYNQILDGSRLKHISEFIDSDLNNNFVDKRLSRTKSNGRQPYEAMVVYNKLCEKASYRPD